MAFERKLKNIYTNQVRHTSERWYPLTKAITSRDCKEKNSSSDVLQRIFQIYSCLIVGFWIPAFAGMTGLIVVKKQSIGQAPMPSQRQVLVGNNKNIHTNQVRHTSERWYPKTKVITSRDCREKNSSSDVLQRIFQIYSCLIVGFWIPAFAGMTGLGAVKKQSISHSKQDGKTIWVFGLTEYLRKCSSSLFWSNLNAA